MPRKDEMVPVKVARSLYSELAAVGQKTGLKHRAMIEDALDWWLDVKAPVLVQAAEKTLSKRKRN
jgi:hypothetical protein